MPFVFTGQELQQDSQTVQSSGLRNRQTLNAMESPEPNRFTKAPSEYRPHFELNAITWILSQTVSGARASPSVACGVSDTGSGTPGVQVVTSCAASDRQQSGCCSAFVGFGCAVVDSHSFNAG